MNLYEINALIEELLSNVVDQTEEGLITADGEIVTFEQLENLNLAREEKIESLLLYVKNLRAEAEAIKAEREALEKREKADRKKADGIAEYVKAILRGEKFRTAKCQASYRTTKSVEADVNLIPEEFVRTKVTKEPDKVALKQALQNLAEGEHINGAVLVEKTNIVIK